MSDESASPRRRPLPMPVTNEEEIERVVRTFYKSVRADAQLGPIFERVIGDNWEPHLQKMFAFWSSVMLMSGRYKGQPMVAHMRLKMVQRHHFERWLGLFHKTTEELCTPETAEAFMERAARIAESLQMGMFFNPNSADPSRKPHIAAVQTGGKRP
ncbi:MAG: group III truncated hemoglobin [Parvibaculum sp.]|uniref:group III truncated hemoglobin n=1 Tax=Parvibaculum sp. TaxID=2024848 RepID=UPI003C781EBE